jgi:TatD DNase family protein
MFLVDSHCHLNLLDLSQQPGGIAAVIARAKAQGVEHFLNVSVSLEDFPQVLQTAQEFDEVSASVGAHPNEQAILVEADELIRLGSETKVKAVGETGLDYYRHPETALRQQANFRAHIQAAKALNKPLIIHTRCAKEDTLKIMKKERVEDIGGVLHCFTEDWDMAQRAIEMNFYISFSGIVTFKNAQTIQNVAKEVPLERMLIETDAPYLAPIPYRGKPNEPAYIRHTAEFIANLRGISIEELAQQTSKNFELLFLRNT